MPEILFARLDIKVLKTIESKEADEASDTLDENKLTLKTAL